MLAVIIGLVFGVTAALALVQLVCFALALYELLNLPEARNAHLDAATLLPACVNVLIETCALVALVLLRPLGARRVRPASRGAGRPALVLVATWPMNRVGFAILQRRLRRDGWRDVVVVAPRVFGADLVEEARSLQRAVESVSTGDARGSIILLAHGTGGVVCRGYLRWADGLGRVTKLVTLASPHQGSKLYGLATSRLLRELRPESELLRDLGEADPVPAAVDCTAIYSSFDLYVLPSRLAYYPGAGNIEVEGVGHFGMLWSRRVYELIRENLEYAAPRADGSGTQPAA